MVGLIVVIALMLLIPGTLILMFLARKVGKIENANFKNSFLVGLFSGVLISLILSLVGLEDIMAAGFLGSIVIYFIIMLLIYTFSGKFIWKTSYLQSFKSNIVWVLILALSISFMFS